MNYEKKYKNALEWARQVMNGETGFIRKEVEEVFPELRESEDEKIRKVLIGWINLEPSTSFNDTFDGFSKEQILAWLEKQGEQNPQGKSALETIKEEKVDNANKVEPKFHEGEWVVCEFTGLAYQVKNSVENLSNHKYGYDLIDGGYISTDEVNYYHLWTIQDAKDGDVLVCPKYAGDIIPNIFIFKGITTKDNDVYCHCSFSKAFIGTECYIANAETINTDFYPATKEQRNILFKAMTDAGYTFDFEKKVIKKRN